jgi:F-type H+-transporting ATPase subunit epsilon
MAGRLTLNIVTPEGTIFSGDVQMVTLPAVGGQIGVLPHHMPLMTQVVPGEITVRRSGGDMFLAVGGGLVDIGGDHVTIVTDLAVEVDRIDEAKVEEARQRAAARLQEKISAEEIASVNASLARSLAQLRVRRRHRM